MKKLLNIPAAELEKCRPVLATRRLAALAMTRQLLITSGTLSASEAAMVDIAHHPSGQPFLNYPIAQKPLCLSVSHSRNWMACLLSDPDNPHGIDLEDATITRAYQKIANNYFSGAENAFVAQKGQLGFYQIWTAKEAMAKCLGQGLEAVLKLDLGKQLANVEFEKQFKVTTANGDYYLSQHLQDPGLIYSIAAKFPF